MELGNSRNSSHIQYPSLAGSQPSWRATGFKPPFEGVTAKPPAVPIYLKLTCCKALDNLAGFGCTPDIMSEGPENVPR